MGRRAVRDTYALERTGPDTEVRRLIVAGQEVPRHYYGVEDEGAIQEFEDGQSIPGVVDYRRPPGVTEDHVPEDKTGGDGQEGELNRPETSNPPTGKRRAGVGRAQQDKSGVGEGDKPE